MGIIGAEQVGRPHEERRDVAPGHVGNQRHQFVSDPVAPETGVGVGGIRDRLERQCSTQRVRLGAPEMQQRSTMIWFHRRQTGCARAAEESEQHGLGLVICGVTGQRVGADQ